MQHLEDFSNFELITEAEKKGFFSGLWSVLTLGGYVTSKMKNVFGLKSILIKSKLSKIESILHDGLKNLALVFPSERVIKANVEKNPAYKAVKSNQKVKNETTITLSKMLYEIEKAILMYEEDQDLNLMKEEIEDFCNDAAAGKAVVLPNFEVFQTEIKNHVKNLRLNKKIVQDMTQRLPRYELKNLALEASILVKTDEDYRKDSRLSLLFQKRKNAIYSKYEKFYDFDELNNWLDYDRFDPTSVKYREQVETAKKEGGALIKNNKISSIIPWQGFKPIVGGKYYIFFEENYEWRALLVELIATDGETNTQMFKPFGIYRVNRKTGFEFKKMTKKEMKNNSIFYNVDIIDTCVYLVQSDKLLFIKDEKIFTKTERVFKFSEVKVASDFNDVVFKTSELRGLGVLKMEEETEKIDTENWKKYELSNFQTGLNWIKKMIKQFLVAQQPQTAAEVKAKEPINADKAEGKYGKYSKSSLKVADEEYLQGIYNDLYNDFTAATKTMGNKMKDEDTHAFLKKFLKDNVYKLPRNYDEILSAATKAVLKRKK